MRPGNEIAFEDLDLSALVRPGELVVWGQAAAEPLQLTGALMASRAKIGVVRAFVGMTWSGSTDPEFLDHVAFGSYCGTAKNRLLGDRLDILPVHYSELASSLAARRPVLLLRLAPGDDDDHFSFGAAQEYLADLLPHAWLVVAEVHDGTPRTGGGRSVRRDELDVIVRTSGPIAQPPCARSGALDVQIARQVVQLVEDGATLQIGLGSIPAAVLRTLSNHRDLGVHSGLIGDEIAELVEAGIVNNARKTIDPGVTVCGLLAGGKRLMCWADRNPALALRPTSYTHAHDRLASLPRFTAINSAIEVDLTGQVNAEVADGRYLGAVGGAANFLRGAHASHGGMPIIALPSSAGERSRIVARLSGPVSGARADVGIIVTEHGTADLRGLTERERRVRMLAIADPRFREAIDREASEGGFR